MIIQNNIKIEDLQKEFSDKYPDLKLEFYSVSHRSEELTSNAYKVNPDTKISELALLDKPVTLSLKSNLKVETLEHRFEDLGLHVQVFRKSGDVWLQTSRTDHKTLKELSTMSNEY